AGALGLGPAVRFPAVVDSEPAAGLRPTVFRAAGLSPAPSFAAAGFRAFPGARPTVLVAASVPALALGLAAFFTLAVAWDAALFARPVASFTSLGAWLSTPSILVTATST